MVEIWNANVLQMIEEIRIRSHTHTHQIQKIHAKAYPLSTVDVRTYILLMVFFYFMSVWCFCGPRYNGILVW